MSIKFDTECHDIDNRRSSIIEKLMSADRPRDIFRQSHCFHKGSVSVRHQQRPFCCLFSAAELDIESLMATIQQQQQQQYGDCIQYEMATATANTEVSHAFFSSSTGALNSKKSMTALSWRASSCAGFIAS